MKTRNILCLLGGLIVCLWGACNGPKQPGTTLLLNTHGIPVDTARLLDELQGLIALSTRSHEVSRTFDIKASARGDTLKLVLSPQMSADRKHVLGQIFDKLIQNPSNWTPDSLKLYYTGNAASVLELFHLDSLQAYPLEIDPASAYWAFEEKENYMSGPLASGEAVSHLSYRLKQPLPGTAYRMGLEDTGTGEPKNETTKIIESLLASVGPSSAAFSVESRDSSIRPLWDSLQVNYRVRTDSLDFWLEWAYVSFPYREFSRFTDQDTLVNASVEKLVEAPVYVFHTLVAPQLSTVITGYTWEDEGIE